MNRKGTWYWLVLAAGLLGLLFLHHRFYHPPETGPAKVLPGFDPAAVTSVQVHPKGQVRIRAERTNGVWQLVEPVTGRAQATNIESLLGALEKLTAATYITPQERMTRPKADEEDGFVPPQATFIIQQAGTPRIIQIGARTPPGDQVYVQAETPGVYVVDADLLRYVPRGPNEWRDTAWVDLQGLAFDRVAVTNGSKVLELQRDPTNQLWRIITPPIQARANAALLGDLLRNLRDMRVLQFVSDSPKLDLESFGLQPPELAIALAQGTNTALLLQFGKCPASNEVYACRAGQPTVVTVASDPLGNWHRSVNDFRDPHLIELTGPVAAMDVLGEEDSFSLIRFGTNGWRVVPQDRPAFPAEGGLVTNLLTALSTLPIVEFCKDALTAPDLPAYGLAVPHRRYVLKSGPANAVLGEIQFGAITNDNIFARRADESSVYSVKLADFQTLPSASLQMRQRRVWNFSDANVANVTIRQHGKERQLVHNGPHEWSIAPGSQGVIEPLSVSETMRMLTEVSATAWVARGATNRLRFGFMDDGYRITLGLKSGGKATLEFGGTDADKTPYAAVTLDDELWIFRFPGWLYENYVAHYLSIRE